MPATDAIIFNDVSFRYQTGAVLHDTNWKVPESTVTGIIGPNGVGKTTMLRLASGLLQATTGIVQLHGTPVANMTARDVARHVALVPQEEPVVFPYTVRQMVTFGRFAHSNGPGFRQKEDDIAVDRAIELCGLKQLENRNVTELSGGEYHRVLFARALSQDTPVLLLDEPGAFMDIKYQVTIFDLLLYLRDQFSKTVVCVTHDLNIASAYFDTVLVLAGNTVVAHDRPQALFTEENLRNWFDIDVSVHQTSTFRYIQVHSRYVRGGKTD